MGKLIRLDDYRPKPTIKIRKFNRAELVKQMSKVKFKVTRK